MEFPDQVQLVTLASVSEETDLGVLFKSNLNSGILTYCERLLAFKNHLLSEFYYIQAL